MYTDSAVCGDVVKVVLDARRDGFGVTLCREPIVQRVPCPRLRARLRRGTEWFRVCAGSQYDGYHAKAHSEEWRRHGLLRRERAKGEETAADAGPGWATAEPQPPARDVPARGRGKGNLRSHPAGEGQDKGRCAGHDGK